MNSSAGPPCHHCRRCARDDVPNCARDSVPLTEGAHATPLSACDELRSSRCAASAFEGMNLAPPRDLRARTATLRGSPFVPEAGHVGTSGRSWLARGQREDGVQLHWDTWLDPRGARAR